MALAFQSTLGLKHADLHLHMDEMEMDHYFGTNDHEEMADYEVVQIRKRSDSGGLEKRSGMFSNNVIIRNKPNLILLVKVTPI